MRVGGTKEMVEPRMHGGWNGHQRRMNERQHVALAVLKVL